MNPRPSLGDQGHVVVFEVRKDYQREFGEWTGENVRLPLAIILNDQVTTAPQINEKLTTNVQITLGSGSMFPGGGRSLQEEKAKSLATVLQSGSLRVKPRLEKTYAGRPAGDSRLFGLCLLGVAIAFGLLTAAIYVSRRSAQA